jgi:hypothetical protein
LFSGTGALIALHASPPPPPPPTGRPRYLLLPASCVPFHSSRRRLHLRDIPSTQNNALSGTHARGEPADRKEKTPFLTLLSRGGRRQGHKNNPTVIAWWQLSYPCLWSTRRVQTGGSPGLSYHLDPNGAINTLSNRSYSKSKCGKPSQGQGLLTTHTAPRRLSPLTQQSQVPHQAAKPSSPGYSEPRGH